MMGSEPDSKRRLACRNCGCVFTTEDPGIAFCSVKCLRSYNRRNGTSAAVAQAVVSTSKRTQTSKPLAQLREEAKEPKPRRGRKSLIEKPPRLCAYCGEPIKRQAYRQKYCCASCAHLDEMTTPKRRCHDCGAPCVGYRCGPCWTKMYSLIEGESAEYGG